MKIILLMLCALLLVNSASAQPVTQCLQNAPDICEEVVIDHLAFAKAAFVSAQIMDMATTMMAVQSGQGREANPLLGAGYGFKAVGIKTAVTVTTFLLMDKLAVKHPRIAKVTLYSLSGVIGAVAVHNYRVAGAR